MQVFPACLLHMASLLMLVISPGARSLVVASFIYWWEVPDWFLGSPDWFSLCLVCSDSCCHVPPTGTTWHFYTPRFNEVERGVYWYHLVRLSVCPSVDRIVSALYLQQYSSDPFHICTSYQTTSEGVSRVMPVSKFKNLKFWRIF